MNEKQEEKALIDRAKKDTAAFGELYRRYVDRIYNYIYYRTGSAGDAEDLTGKVFFKAMSHIKGYKHMGLPFSAWLYRIAHNLVANYHRDRSRKQEISLDNLPGQILPKSDLHPETRVVHSQEVDALLSRIRDLAPNRQELLILKFVDQLSNAEIGQIMRKSEGAIKSLYHRTLLELRELMSEDSDQPQ
ncbi:MAG: sigma-70 family RNA polymerase sigma factor [Anaerolineaceae bacterium]|nr:sigma-70 family RNA polymerase sigma factor [Anaerolineaceae bacterium]